MADKGFTIQDLLPLGVSLNLPPFLVTSSHVAAEDVLKKQEIASLRLHVNVSSTRLRIFKWLKGQVSKETGAASVGEYSR